MLDETIALTDQIYTPAAIRETIEAFRLACSASFTAAEATYILRMTAPDRHTRDEFLNYALALSAQELLG
jgi:hypothetical protein